MPGLTFKRVRQVIEVARPSSKRFGFEFKHTIAPGVTKSMQIAAADLKLTRLDIVHIGKESYPLMSRLRAVAFERLQTDVKPLVS
jgi:hypothetical protein